MSQKESRDVTRRVMDEAGRNRRARKALEALEQDNFHDDPHANLVMSKKAPRFDENLEAKRRKTRGSEVSTKQRYRRNLATLLEEDQASHDGKSATYVTITAPESKLPSRPLCAVCGFPSPYVCVSCGARYCGVRCLNTHKDTRCLKYTV